MTVLKAKKTKVCSVRVCKGRHKGRVNSKQTINKSKFHIRKENMGAKKKQ